MQGSRILGRVRLGLRSVLAVALCCGAARSQQADVEPSERYRLQWVREGGAESCVSGPALARLLPQVVALNPVAEGEPLLLDGVIEPAPAPLTFRARITVRVSGTKELVGERELTTRETKCATLTPALLLVLAMSVDPEAAQGGLPEQVRNELRRERDEDVDVWPAPPAGSRILKPQTAATKPTARVLPRGSSGRARMAPRSRRAAGASLEGALALSAELQPALAPGAMVGGRLRWCDDWSTSLQAVAWWPQAVAPAPSPYLLDDGIDFHAAQLVLAVCRRALGKGAGYVEGCAGATLGLRWLSARALAVKNNPWRLFLGPEVGVRTGLQLGQGWSLGAGVTATAALRRERFAYDDYSGRQRTLFEPYWLSGRALLGMEKEL